jgi:hypothetical protein
MGLFQKMFGTKEKKPSKVDWKEFIPGTKVSLKNEFGLVLDKTVDSDLVGLIRLGYGKEK